jgi:hypothetical protein
VTNSITPPPELVRQWDDEGTEMFRPEYQLHLATCAAQWAADQELEACLANIHTMYGKDKADWLRSMRRPKPPSLKEQAQAALDTYIYGNPDHGDKQNTYNTIRRALEKLPDN